MPGRTRGESFTVWLTRLEGSGWMSNGWPNAVKPRNWITAAFIPKGIPRWHMWWHHTTCAIYQLFGMMHLTSHTGQCLLAKAPTDVFQPVTAKLRIGLGCNQGQQPWLPMHWYFQCIKVTGQLWIPLHIGAWKFLSLVVLFQYSMKPLFFTEILTLMDYHAKGLWDEEFMSYDLGRVMFPLSIALSYM